MVGFAIASDDFDGQILPLHININNGNFPNWPGFPGGTPASCQILQ
jgi:hypothetical protein